MRLVNSSDGLSTNTTCGADPLVMRLEESRSGSLLATADGSFPSDPETSEPDIYLKAVFDKLAFNDCYYGTNPDSAVTGPGFFRIIFDRTGAIEKITWHFDNEAVMRPRKHGKGELFVVLHKHALTSQTVKWTDKGGTTVELTDTGGTGVVVGSFELWNYSNTEGWELVGEAQQLKFTLTISPQEPVAP